MRFECVELNQTFKRLWKKYMCEQGMAARQQWCSPAFEHTRSSLRSNIVDDNFLEAFGKFLAVFNESFACLFSSVVLRCCIALLFCSSDKQTTRITTTMADIPQPSSATSTLAIASDAATRLNNGIFNALALSKIMTNPPPRFQTPH